MTRWICPNCGWVGTLLPGACTSRPSCPMGCGFSSSRKNPFTFARKNPFTFVSQGLVRLLPQDVVPNSKMKRLALAQYAAQRDAGPRRWYDETLREPTVPESCRAGRHRYRGGERCVYCGLSVEAGT